MRSFVKPDLEVGYIDWYIKMAIGKQTANRS